jgi:hypothetical protein
VTLTTLGMTVGSCVGSAVGSPVGRSLGVCTTEGNGRQDDVRGSLGSVDTDKAGPSHQDRCPKKSSSGGSGSK